MRDCQREREIGVLWHARITLFGLKQGTSFGMKMCHFAYIEAPISKRAQKLTLKGAYYFAKNFNKIDRYVSYFKYRPSCTSLLVYMKHSKNKPD